MTKSRLSWTFAGDAPGHDDGVPAVRALEAHDMGVAFQPIVSTRDGRVFAYEVLARCKRVPFENPAELFRVGQDQKACGYLGRLVRAAAFERCPTTPLFVNVHPQELASRWLVRPDDPMAFHAPGVFLEITETAAFTHFDLCMSVLREVCDRVGARLVVDDFGAGHSNLERVFELRPAVVKLDGSLVRGLHLDARRATFVRRLVDMCWDLGARVVAECVETPDELSAIRDAGIQLAQGFLFAPPAFPPPDVEWPETIPHLPHRRSSLPPPRRRTRPPKAAAPGRKAGTAKSSRAPRAGKKKSRAPGR